MKPVSHPSNTRTLQAPAGWDHEQTPVAPLGITDHVVFGLPCIWTYWEPNAQEKAAIAAGGKVMVTLVGRRMPPAMVSVEQPPSEGAESPFEAAPVPQASDSLDALRWGANVAETLLSIGKAVGFGRAQQILGEQWDAEHNCAPRGQMGVTAPLAPPVQQAAPITAAMMVDDGGDTPAYCVMAAYRSKSAADAALAALTPPAVAAPGQVRKASDAVRDVLAERRRQVDVEGWTAEHDDSHVNDEIAALACFYAMPPGAREWTAKETGYGDTLGQAIRPEGWDAKEGDRRRELVKAAALVVAEIERLDRAAARSGGDSHA